MSDPEVVLETRRLTKRFGALVAVNNVDFRLGPRELRAVIGCNGAGKSTFFAMLMGAIKPSSGEIRIAGVDVTHEMTHQISRRGVSLAYQITNVFPQLTVSGNLRLSAQSRMMNFNPFRDAASRPAIEQVVDTVLADIALTGKRDERAANLSHGEQKYLEIGIALATRPSILLLDEPTAGMSVEETNATAGLIKSLSQRLSVVLVEHDMDVVLSIADTITVLHQGEVLAEGAPDAIRANRDVQRVYLRAAA